MDSGARFAATSELLLDRDSPTMRLHFLAFGLVGYLAALLPMVYLVGFLANVGVSKSVDSGPAGPTGTALAVDLTLLLAFALLHSLLARPAAKARLAAHFPAELERSLYSLVAGAQIALLCWLWQPLPVPVWSVPAEWAALRLLLWTIQGTGWGIVVLALLTIGSAHLFGLRQAWAGARQVPHEPPPIESRGIYRRIRHPIYAGTLVGFWATPEMSQGRLLLVGVLTIYLFIGLRFEERELERAFGETYLAHRRAVPGLLPRLGK